MQRLGLPAAVVLMLMAGPAGAGIYKWVDADGKVHYGDRPPAGEASSSVTVTPAPGLDADHGARTRKQRRLLEAIEAERAEQERRAADAEQAKRERQDRCRRARATLADLERANLVYTTDESGARTYMSEDERRRAMDQATAWIREHCP